MKIKQFSDGKKYENLDGHSVHDFSSPDHGIHDQDIAIDGRYPERGYVRNGLGMLMVRVLKRHGHILLNSPEGEKKIAIHNGSRVHIGPREDYALEGSMEIMLVEMPAVPRENTDYIE